MSELIVRYAPGDVTAEALRRDINELENSGYLQTQARNHTPVHIVHLALSQVNGLGNVPYQGFSESLDNIATYFNIEPTDTYNLYQAADLLVKQKFEAILHKLVGEMTRGHASAP
jgi:hypothetical protein